MSLRFVCKHAWLFSHRGNIRLLQWRCRVKVFQISREIRSEVFEMVNAVLHVISLHALLLMLVCMLNFSFWNHDAHQNLTTKAGCILLWAWVLLDVNGKFFHWKVWCVLCVSNSGWERHSLLRTCTRSRCLYQGERTKSQNLMSHLHGDSIVDRIGWGKPYTGNFFGWKRRDVRVMSALLSFLCHGTEGSAPPLHCMPAHPCWMIVPAHRTECQPLPLLLCAAYMSSTLVQCLLVLSLLSWSLLSSPSTGTCYWFTTFFCFQWKKIFQSQ